MIILANPEQVLEDEIAHGATQEDAALTLAFALRDRGQHDWPRMMKAVMGRWPKGRERVLGMAWKRYGEWLAACREATHA